VDNFLISAKTQEIAKEVQAQIQSKMTNELNNLGIIKSFNGMDVLHTRNYIKISCQTYTNKIISHHEWANKRHSNKPIPMRNNSSYLAESELTEGPEDPKAQRELEQQMGFNYHWRGHIRYDTMPTGHCTIHHQTITVLLQLCQMPLSGRQSSCGISTCHTS
jgi:hypothetical protein